jgi:colicin import membrane protein
VDDQPSKSGIIASGALHAALLAAILIGFAGAPKFDDAGEAFPVETITQSQFNQIMKGKPDAKPAKTPVEKPAPKPVEATAPSPPVEPAKIEPPPLKHVDDPGEDTPPPPPPKPAAEAPPPPPPEPPQREAAAPPPPPPPDDAEIDRPKPRVDPKPAPAPPEPPLRPKVVEKPKDPTPDKAKADSVAKFLEKVKADEEQKTPSKPKSGDAAVDPPHQAYDPTAIAKIIGAAKPGQNRQMAALTAQGSPTASAQRMSPSLSASLDGWLQEAYLNCWTQPPTMPPGVKYVAKVSVSFNPDGSLSAQPQLVNPPSDPAWRAYADSAMRAVLRCNPLHVPPQYAPYYEQWRAKTVHFDPEEAQG